MGEGAEPCCAAPGSQRRQLPGEEGSHDQSHDQLHDQSDKYKITSPVNSF